MNISQKRDSNLFYPMKSNCNLDVIHLAAFRWRSECPSPSVSDRAIKNRDIGLVNAN